MDVMGLLLEGGSDAYVHFGLILHDASYHGRIDVIHLLLQHNIDVNATNQLKNGALHLASIKGQAKIAQLSWGTGLTSMHKAATTTLLYTTHRQMAISGLCKYCLDTERTCTCGEETI